MNSKVNFRKDINIICIKDTKFRVNLKGTKLIYLNKN